MKTAIKSITAEYVETYDSSGAVSNTGSKTESIWFTKPNEVLINPPESDGYRAPSRYAASVMPIVLLASLEGGTKYPNWPEPIGMTLTGTSCLTLNSGNIPNLSYFGFNKTQELRMKILNNIQDEVFDAAMVLAEMQSTVATGVNLLHRLGRSLAAFKTKNPRSFYYLLNGKTFDKKRPTQRFLKQTAAEYLQWKYGIMPTMFDIQGVTEALDLNAEGTLFRNPPLLVARANIKQPVSTDVVFSDGWRNFTGTVNSQLEYKARCDYSVSAEGLRALNRYGLGLTSVATVMWDKTPFTFVLDMAMPIAQIIKAWGALAGVDVRGYSETMYVGHDIPSFTRTNESVTSPGQIDEYRQIASITAEGGKFFEMSRSAYDKPPMPLPFVRNPIKTGNLATVIALFTQLRKG